MNEEPVTVGPWIDNHCHLDHPGRGTDGSPDAPDPRHLVHEARAAGVVAMITVGTDPATSLAGRALADSIDGVWATAGVHPHEATQGVEGLRSMLADDTGHGHAGGFVAVGECGLDFHYDHSPRAVQRRVFAEQIDLANELDLPLVIHTRDAWQETFEILDERGVPRRAVFHCFTGGPQDAQGCLERAGMLSISGIVTFPSASELREAVANTPLRSLMVETDTPYLAPVPHRGRPNRPALVAVVGAAIAELHEVPVPSVAAATTANAREFYGLADGQR